MKTYKLSESLFILIFSGLLLSCSTKADNTSHLEQLRKDSLKIDTIIIKDAKIESLSRIDELNYGKGLTILNVLNEDIFFQTIEPVGGGEYIDVLTKYNLTDKESDRVRLRDLPLIMFQRAGILDLTIHDNLIHLLTTQGILLFDLQFTNILSDRLFPFKDNDRCIDLSTSISGFQYYPQKETYLIGFSPCGIPYSKQYFLGEMLNGFVRMVDTSFSKVLPYNFAPSPSIYKECDFFFRSKFLLMGMNEDKLFSFFNFNNKIIIHDVKGNLIKELVLSMPFQHNLPCLPLGKTYEDVVFEKEKFSKKIVYHPYIVGFNVDKNKFQFIEKKFDEDNTPLFSFFELDFTSGRWKYCPLENAIAVPRRWADDFWFVRKTDNGRELIKLPKL